MVNTLAIILISLFIAGMLLYGFLSEYALSEKEKTLSHYAQRIIQMQQYLIQNNSIINRQLFQINVEAYGEDSNSIIFIVDSMGEIVLASSRNLKNLEGNYIDKDLVGQLSKGKEIKIRGNFGTLLTETYLILGYPIKYNDRVIGSVFLNTPIPELQRLSLEVFNLFLRAIGISALIAALSVYFMSRRISNPLREIGRVARKIAGGDFDARVKIKSNDEVGELAGTFNYMAEALSKLENVRRNFIANVSHELRTPMTTIIGFIEGIADGTIPEDKHKYYLSIVKQEAVRLTGLTNDILDLAKMESGEEPVNMKVFNISELIRRNIIKFENQINNKRINVEVDFHRENQYVLADQDAIERVVTNLLDNAVKFTPEEGIITIRTTEEDEKIRISIEDAGIGISKDDLPYIWDRFFKTDKSRSKDKIGTGLGLAIVKNIIQKHQENIWVESEMNRGSRFTFTLQGCDKE